MQLRYELNSNKIKNSVKRGIFTESPNRNIMMNNNAFSIIKYIQNQYYMIA